MKHQSTNYYVVHLTHKNRYHNYVYYLDNEYRVAAYDRVALEAPSEEALIKRLGTTSFSKIEKIQK